MLLPTDLEEFVPEGHLVRVISGLVDGLSLDELRLAYRGGGASRYHPRLMLKILAYAYTQNILTSRRIAKALRENLYFMWLAGTSRPDFRTLNRFRSITMKTLLDTVFQELLTYLVDHGYVKLETSTVDGTKIEANANRHQPVWRKNVERYREKVDEQIRVLLAEIEEANAAEQAEYGERDLEEFEGKTKADVDSASLKECISRINERLKQLPENKPIARAVRKLEKDCLPRLERYEEQEETLAGRNSYAKTDPDATFMRMKEDVMGKAELRPAYNAQIGTENQFVVAFSVHQQPADSACLVPHLEAMSTQAPEMPAALVGDAGYGSEPNYAYLEQAGIESFLKYPTFDRERKASWAKQVYRVENWAYDEASDEFVCPQDHRLRHRADIQEEMSNGYIAERSQYECSECGSCPVKMACTKSAGNRRVEVSLPLMRWRAQAKRNLLSERGAHLRARRGVEVESVFGRLKQDCGFRRFLLRGLDKVRIEWGLVCIAHNLVRMAA
jgi:transposase